MLNDMQNQGCSIVRVGIEGTHAPIFHIYVSQSFNPALLVAEYPASLGLLILPDGHGIRSRKHYTEIHFKARVTPRLR